VRRWIVVVTAIGVASIGAHTASCSLLAQAREAPSAVPPARPDISAVAQATPEEFVRAAGDGNLRLVRQFLESGFDPNSRNRDGFTPIIWAAGQGHLSVVTALVRSGASVDASSLDGTTALIAAASGGRTEILPFLLKSRAAIDARRGDGQTALIRASAENEIGAVRLLLAQRADIEAADSRGMTSLMYASANLGPDDPDGRTLPLVKLLLSAGADSNHSALDGSTALSWAARRGEEAIVRTLLGSGAKVDVADANGRTALMHAALGVAGPSTAALLIQHGASIQARDREDSTATILAARRRTPGVLKVLLENQANPNARNNQGLTALMESVRFGRYENAKLLIDAGADPAVRDARGRTAVDIARERHDTVTLDLLNRPSH